MRTLKAAETVMLEQMIDATGLARVLEAIGDICVEKAAHIRENWQDDVTAKPWDRMSRPVYRVYAKAIAEGI